MPPLLPSGAIFPESVALVRDTLPKENIAPPRLVVLLPENVLFETTREPLPEK
jgi:hypothetical protein